jgi:hypothetical protein
MFESIRKEWPAKIALILFFVLAFWWLFIYTYFPKDNIQNQIFSATYGIIALLGGVWGIRISIKWGGYKSILGRSILMFAFGLLFQEFGQLAYSFYAYFLKVQIPYPSVGDIGYFGSIPLYAYGVILLAKVSGARIKLRSFSHQLIAVIFPLLMLVIAYVFFLKDYVFDWSQPLKIFLDFGYPMGEAIYISLAFVTWLLSRHVLGGIMRDKIFFILFALFIQFLADFTYL